MKKKILFAGAYGIENAGDDLPLLVLCQNLKKSAPHLDFEFTALSRHPSAWEEKQYGVKMLKNLEYESREEAEGKWFNGLNFGDDTERLNQLKNEISEADLLILGAGNFFIDLTIDVFRGPIPKFALYVFLAEMYHTPVMLYGISAGPLTTEWGQDLTCWISESADVVTVRDQQSRSLLESLLKSPANIYVLPDSTLGAKSLSAVRLENLLETENIQESSKIKVAVGLRDLSVVLPAHEAEMGWSHLAQFMNDERDHYEFLFIPQSTYHADDDRATAAEFVKRLNPEVDYRIITHRYDPRELIGFYQACQVTLAIRLHAAVFSAMVGTPVVAVNYLSKVSGFMNSIHQQQYIIELQDLISGFPGSVFKKAVENRKEIAANLNQQMDLMKTDVDMYAKLALDLLVVDE